ncbi:DNA-directed RNA polymerase subunit M [Sulfolobus tengchongensis]|uniref:DNA-directed RNA polymerase subunit M n=1 Tax=Sulfolobus tengchongensis TaxID=207809 RepID=A0AAX4KYZ4_9CREN
MKKEARIAIFSEGNELYAICVFRGVFLEKLFLDTNKDRLTLQFISSSIINEVKYSNLNIGKNVSEQEAEKICQNIVKKISEKLNTHKVNG